MRLILLTVHAFCAFSAIAVAATPATDGAAVERRRIELEASRQSSPISTALQSAAFARTRVPGIAQTSISSRFAKRSDAFGDAGLLCGLQPHPDTAGAAAAFGHDPDGKFVGAKLRLAF